MATRQLKLQGVEPGQQHNRIYETEAAIQRTIVEGLSWLGYIVLLTQHQYKLQTCPSCQCRFRPIGGYGTSKAISDLLVSHPHWGIGVWLGLEVKGPKTPVSPEQKLLAAQGRIVIVRSWEEAKAAVEATHERNRRTP
jgi:hypothetical protein